MAIKESGLYYLNKMARISVLTIEETIGAEAMQTIYKTAGVPLKHYPPPDNYAKEFDFAYLGAINEAFEQLYGPRGARGLSLHAGRAGFAEGLAEFGNIIGVGELAFKAIPLGAKLTIGLRAMAETFTKFSDQQTTTEDAGDYIIYTIHRCPVCWGRQSDKPICYSATGLLEEGMRWVSGGKSFLIEEVVCIAAGGEGCIFHIPKEPLA